ncbi:MAG: hypothetical protein AAGJ40_17975 [Planctomycetota bacterium]
MNEFLAKGTVGDLAIVIASRCVGYVDGWCLIEMEFESERIVGLRATRSPRPLEEFATSNHDSHQEAIDRGPADDHSNEP